MAQIIIEHNLEKIEGKYHEKHKLQAGNELLDLNCTLWRTGENTYQEQPSQKPPPNKPIRFIDSFKQSLGIGKQSIPEDVEFIYKITKMILSQNQ